ncbi:TetR/AcrR family transcriptional regulator [Tomitella fengzijianii]|uniref:TetR/AcrR family transcriptional regulator n=1 Tax=Tomitella fengzijianii TaxID=2597660 RepID=A0A516X8W3_9ACTN|nr:TetR/AcrR family transcriptional regulator [Tomitella fengzijianii]QDQ99463.1 TetR/AcrR family transcriptional regulator [Tomitella fengzijianii]
MAAPELLREPPVTERGARTRAALITAARTVFERSGYLDTRLTDITREAHCSTGSFYTYFKNKEEVFAAVLEQAQDEMLHPGMGRVADPDDAYAVLEASNRAYLEAYRRNAELMVLMEQVAGIDPAFRELRNRRGEVFIARNARAIADLQRRGVADPGLDPMLASRALSSMVSRLAFLMIGHGEGVQADGPRDGVDPETFEQIVDTVTRIWANGLRMPPRRAHAPTDS